jgi:O-antigen/teichoic acid export membrane protein
VGRVPEPTLSTAEGDVPDASPGGAPSGGLGQRAAASVLWTVLQKWGVRIGGLLTVAILARLLAPSDFGVVAIAMTVVPLIYLLSDLGFSTYVVQASDVSQRVLSTAFWYSASAGILMAGGLVLLAPALGEVFSLPAVVPVLMGLSPAVLLVAFASVPVALLRRRLAFRSLALQSFAAGALGQVTAIVAAFSGWGVWALVLQLLVNQAVVLVCAWVSARWRPTLQFSRSTFATMFRFGTNVVGVELVALARLWAETAIIVSTLGVTALGFLNIAQRLIQATQDLSAAAILPVSTVVFSQIRESVERLRAGYLRALELSYVVVVPVMVLVAVAAPLIIPLMFGGQWATSILPAQALAVAGIMTLGAMLDNGLFYGMGKPGRWLAYAFGIDVLTVGMTAFASRYGLVGISIGFVAVAFVATALRWVLVSRLVVASPWRVAKPFALVSIAGAVSAAGGLAAMAAFAALPHLALLAVVGAVVLALHLVVVRIVQPAPFHEVVGLVGSRLGRRSASVAGGAAS